MICKRPEWGRYKPFAEALLNDIPSGSYRSAVAPTLSFLTQGMAFGACEYMILAAENSGCFRSLHCRDLHIGNMHDVRCQDHD